MSTVEDSIDVDVPVRVADDQWTQFESYPSSMAGVESITQTDATQSHWVTKIGMVSRATHTRLIMQIDWEPKGLVEKAGATIGVDDHRVKATPVGSRSSSRSAVRRPARGEVTSPPTEHGPAGPRRPGRSGG